MAKRLFYFLRDNYLYLIIFVSLLFFSVHSFDSIGQDIGRHIKIGEIIWQTGEVPKVNLFSFVEPNFPFINHHWLSEVLLYKIFNFLNFSGLVIFKTVFVVGTFLLLVFSVKNNTRFWPLVISLLLSISIFISRTEVRPELFSFFILAFFIFVFFKTKHAGKSYYLWFLPLAQLLWVNLHIYFFLGPLLLLAFIVDRYINAKLSRNLIVVGALSGVVTLINPNGVQGALIPFKILSEYGYNIFENQAPVFLLKSFGPNLSIGSFILSVGILVILFLLNIRNYKNRAFEIISSIFFAYAGFKMLRNLPLYAIASMPVQAILLTDVLTIYEKKWWASKKLSPIFKVAISVSLILLIFLIQNNSFYRYTKSSKIFGLSVPNGLENAVNFVKENKIRGPMFNNFNIGGYLIWRFYPEERVFVDNRPEAYSLKFFEDTYKPMQDSPEKWRELSEKYGINFVFFSHDDKSNWAQKFLFYMRSNEEWPIVYLNEEVVIFIKNTPENSRTISHSLINDKNAEVRLESILSSSNKDKMDLYLTMSRISYELSWLETSLYFADMALELNQNVQEAYLYKGLVYASSLDRQSQELARDNIKKSIELGLKDSQYYTILGVVYMNLGESNSAKASFQKALEIDEDNLQAKDFLDKYF